MLQAILNRKAGRNLRNDEVHWSRLFSQSEDSLTSSILGTMMYLPIELFWSILNQACSEPVTKSKPDILTFEFWPHWDAEQTINTKFIEPDAFIGTDEVNLIIEAKRYDHGGQRKDQWQNQLLAYKQEFEWEEEGNDSHEEKPSKDILLLSLGGNADLKTETLTINDREFKIIKCSWDGLLREVSKVRDIIEQSETLLHATKSVGNILKDIEAYFQLHGYITDRWSNLSKFNNLSRIKLAKPEDVMFQLNKEVEADVALDTFDVTNRGYPVNHFNAKSVNFF